MNKRTFHWSNAVVIGLLACDVALTVSGALSHLMQGELAAADLSLARWVCVMAFAGVTGFALGVTQAAASAAQMLHGKPEHVFARRLAWICALLCAGVSVFGVEMAGDLLTGETTVRLDRTLLLAAGLGLAGIKPAMSFVLNACRQIAETDWTAHLASQRLADDAAETARRDADRTHALALAETRAKAAPETAANDATPASPAPVSPLTSKGETAAKRPRPAVSRYGVASLPLTEDELAQAIASIVSRDGAKVVSLASVAREASVLFDRPVPKTRVEQHPKRRELFEAAKAA